MNNLAYANELASRAAALIGRPEKCPGAGRELKCGLDLGTAYIVLAVLDESDSPVACETRFASVIKDGLVVDYFGTLEIVKELKAKIEAGTGQELRRAAIAMPPGTGTNFRTHKYIAEGAGFEVTNILDEPTAANAALRVRNGAVVDIGGGTTGYAVFADGKVAKVGDEPTGGTHLSLVIAGNRGIPFDEAEDYKKDSRNHRALFPVVRPVIEKMATIVKKGIEGYGVDTLYLCGGTCMLAGVGEVFESVCGLPARVPEHPMLITPLGIALCS